MGQFLTAFVNSKTGRLIAKQFSNWDGSRKESICSRTYDQYRELAENCDRAKTPSMWVRARTKAANRLFALQSPVTCIRLVAPDY